MQDQHAVAQAPALQEATQDTAQDNRKSGRPRSEASRRAILEAARRLLSHTPVQKLSIEAIAKKAGVGKTTIYRWWPSKAAVVMEAIFTQAGFQNILPTTSSATEGIQTQLDKLIRQLGGKNGRVVAEILMEAQPDPESLRLFISRFLKSRYDSLSTYLVQGKESGEFRENLNVDEAVDLLLGPIFFRLITGQSLDDNYAQAYLPLAIRALQ